MKQYHHMINGKQFQGEGEEVGVIYNPALGVQTGQVSFATHNDVNDAVGAALAAFPKWSATPIMTRARLLYKYKALLEQHADEIAELLSLQHGKVLSDAKGELARGLEVVEYACGLPHLIKGEFSENAGTNIDCHSVRQALGVCAGITPFNFPVMIPLWMFPIAITCGNTFVLKPSEKDPAAPLRLVELFYEAGYPEGVLNLVNGNKTAVDALLTHPDIKAVSFVGSTPIARYIYQTGTAHDKRVQAMGGAKNHMVIMPDADLDQVADALVGAAYGSAGERCMAISVAVTVGQSSQPLIDKLIPKIEALKIGHPLDPSSELGPLVTQDHYARVASYIERGVAEGANLVVDGRTHKACEGYFMGGSLFAEVKPHMQIYRDEIFGPVLCVMHVDTLDEAIELVGKNPYGNGTSIFTQSGEAARHYAHKIQVGMVGVNIPIPVPVGFHSFGGWKESSFGDHGMHGLEALHFYTKLKTITSRWPHQTPIRADFNIPVMK